MDKTEIVKVLKSCLPNAKYCIKITKPRWMRSWGKGYYIEIINPQKIITVKFAISQKLLDRIDIEALKRIFARGIEIYDKSSHATLTGN